MKNRYERGELLRKAREAKGYTQVELAELLNYSNKTLSKWETGESYPTDYGTLKKYASLLDLDINEIVDGRNLDDKYKINIGNIVIDIRNVIKIIITILFTIFIMLLMFYLVYSYFEKGKIRIYDLKIDSNVISLSNHTLFVSNKINILDFAKIEETNNINELVLYYREKDEYIEIFRGSNIGFKIKDKRSNNENHLNNIERKNVYLDINYKDGTIEKYKVYFIEEYVNNKMYSINSEVTHYYRDIKCNKLKSMGFINREGTCLKEVNGNRVVYNERTKTFSYDIYGDNESIIIEKRIDKDYYMINHTDINGNVSVEIVKLIDAFNSNNKFIKELYYYEKEMFSS